MTPAIHPPTTAAETFGLPPAVPILIAKLRNLDPAYLADIRGRKTI
jgi:hypothetical protein